MLGKIHGFQKLTPTQDVNIEGYEDALNYVFKENDLWNIAISGAYGAGKSSVLESYKAKHKKKFLHISLAHFEDTNKKAEEQEKESVLEWKVLNQLLHQIPHDNIPKTNFPIKKEMSVQKAISWAVGFVVFILAFFHIIFFDNWQTHVNNTSTEWIKDLLRWPTSNSSVLLSGIICAALIGVLFYKLIQAQVNKNIFKKISIEKFKVEMRDGSEESYFDKHLNEVLYLFKRCKADVIVFEDIDRYNTNRIFKRLREINRLVNIQCDNASPLRFFYLIRDDIFTSRDRTKFFDFIIPIVPVVDSSNSCDQLIRHLTDNGDLQLFDEHFLQGLSLYIDDMRMLKNICNEFSIYRKRLDTTELNPNKLMAMLAYKNLFPHDFNALQLRKGFVFTLFENKSKIISRKIDKLNDTLEKEREKLENVKNEYLESDQEIELVMEDKRIKINNSGKDSAQKQNELQIVNIDEARRKVLIKNKKNSQESEIEKNIRRVEKEVTSIKNQVLHQMLSQEDIAEVATDFEDICTNDYFALFEYLIQNGHIDESYADYMTYFYEDSLTVGDKIFIRSVLEKTGKPPGYSLHNPQKVVSYLNAFNFCQPETFNYDLLFYLLKKCAKVKLPFPRFNLNESVQMTERIYLEAMIEQILRDDVFLFDAFFHDFHKRDTSRVNFLVNFLHLKRSDALDYIISFVGADFVFRTLIATPTEYIAPDSMETLSRFISSNPSILDKTQFEKKVLRTKFGWGLTVGSIHKLQLYKKLAKLQVRFLNMNDCNFDSQLVDYIYESRSYELTYSNITYWLKLKYELIETDDFRHKNYTLIMEKSESPLQKYVDANINDYISEIVQNCKGKIYDDEVAVLDILNNDRLSVASEIAYLGVLTTVIQDITAVDDPRRTLWDELLKLNLVARTESNIFDHYWENDCVLTNDLIVFMNGGKNEYDFSFLCLYEDDVQSKFFNEVLKCNELSNIHYKNILQSLEHSYDRGFEIKNIDSEKILILIDIGAIPMHVDSLIFMREHYSDAVMSYIEKGISEYVIMMSDECNLAFKKEEVLDVLLRPIKNQFKLSLLKKIDGQLSAKDQRYSDRVKAHILSNHLDENDIPHFLESYSSEGQRTQKAIEQIACQKISVIFENNLSIDKNLFDKLMASNITLDAKQKLFAVLLPSLSQVECKHYLDKLSLSTYLLLFNQKRPIFAKNDINARLLLIFKQKEWITEFWPEKKDGEAYYRAIGRKNVIA